MAVMQCSSVKQATAGLRERERGEGWDSGGGDDVAPEYPSYLDLGVCTYNIFLRVHVDMRLYVQPL